jgi:F-type H+-transporting ATPase subunit gamma
MATLREVKKRIRTVVSTKRITKAMEMVAAAKLRRAQQRVEQTRPYAAKMDEMLRNLADGASGDISHPFFEQREIKKKTLVLIASDRGLCGSFNANIIRRATAWLEENSDFELEIVAVGKRANDFFKSKQWPVVSVYSDWGGVLPYDEVRRIVKFLT